MRTDRYILDDDGNPIPCEDLHAWAFWLERARRTREVVVAQDVDESDPARTVKVSTVFLGIDHRFLGNGPPILWETVVFGGPLDGEMDRYSSREAALRGHQAICERVTAAILNVTPQR